MKTKTWILLLAAVAIACLGLSLWLLQPGEQAFAVKVISEGKVVQVLSLAEDTRVEIATDRGTNVVTVQNGKVAVTEADCPDGYCMARGFCSGGTQIVCLPNRLVLEFTGNKTLDAITG